MNNENHLKNTHQNSRRIIRVGELCQILSRSRSSIRRDVEAGILPSPIKLGSRSIGWKSDEIEAWIDSRPRALTVDI